MEVEKWKQSVKKTKRFHLLRKKFREEIWIRSDRILNSVLKFFFSWVLQHELCKDQFGKTRKCVLERLEA